MAIALEATLLHVLALDFDGVICDSAAETGTTGWLGAQLLWPTLFPGTPPPDIIARFRQCRPVIETGFESILLMRFLREERPPQAIMGGFQKLCRQTMRAESLPREKLVRLFGTVRDDWRRRDAKGWLNTHEFFPGVIEALNAAATRPIYIITTKERRFAADLAQAGGLELPEPHIFGLESGKKSGVLAELSRQHPGAVIHFVEDRLKTLEGAAARGEAQLRLYLAVWGYNTAAERRRAAANPAVSLLRLENFAEFAQNPAIHAT